MSFAIEEKVDLREIGNIPGQDNNEDLFIMLQRDELKKKSRWERVLRSDAEELADLLSSGKIEVDETEEKVVDIGGHAFRIGGVECMKYLYAMTKEIISDRTRITPAFHYISIWWDGIGSWRSRWLDGEYLLQP